MNAIDVLADFIRTGSCFGLTLDSTLAEVDARLPLQHAESLVGQHDEALYRDYGLLEFSFARRPGWVCTNVVAQIHRLARVPEIRADWSDFVRLELPERLTWTAIEATLARDESVVLVSERPGVGQIEFRFNTHASVHVVTDPETTPGEMDAGDVWSVSIYRT